MDSKNLIYLKINLLNWIQGTIDEINPDCTKKEWDVVWLKSYFCAGGRSKNSGTKGCPKNAAYCLYKLGRIQGSNIPFAPLSYRDIYDMYGRNALYAIIAVEILNSNRSLDKNTLWKKTQEKYS